VPLIGPGAGSRATRQDVATDVTQADVRTAFTTAGDAHDH